MDPTLRFEVSLDEETVATYSDASRIRPTCPRRSSTPSPSRPRWWSARAGERLPPPEARPGRVVLKIEMPVPAPGRGRLRLAYQTNEGSADRAGLAGLRGDVARVELVEDAPDLPAGQPGPRQMEFAGFPAQDAPGGHFELALQPDTGS